jgi:AcrR family transcriptional regulator
MASEDQLEILEAREKILASASELFSRQGYETTSLAQVAREAKVSKALIFWHFDSKEELYRSALRRTLEPYFINNEVLRGLDERDQIARLIDQFYDFVHENVYSVRFFLSLTLRAEQQGDEGLVRVLELYRMFRSSIAEVLDSGCRRGLFRAEIDTGLEADLIMATLAGILVQQFMSDPASGEPRALIAHLKETLFQRVLLNAGGTPAGRPE